MMSDSSQPRCSRHLLLIFPLALAAGFLGANALADAAGITQPAMAENKDVEIWANVLRVGCGVIVGFIALGAMVLLRETLRRVLAILGRTPHRPAMAVAIALLICGTACVLATLQFEYQVMTAGSSVAAGANVPGMPGLAQISIGARSTIGGQLAALATFLLGASLIGLGVWSSLAPADCAPSRPAPPAV